MYKIIYTTILLILSITPLTVYSEVLKLDYEGFSVWLDCEKKELLSFVTMPREIQENLSVRVVSILIKMSPNDANNFQLKVISISQNDTIEGI